MQIKTLAIRTALIGLAVITWLAFVFFTAFYGWWMKPVVSPNDSAGFLQYAQARLEAENSGGNSALILIEEGQIAGEFYSSSKDSINADTVFSTASLSKWVAAAAVMKLVQNEKLNLDDSVLSHISRWSFPPSDFNPSAVTIRHLLSHTAGIKDGLGFGDYLPDEELPSLEESLSNPRASSGEKVSLTVSAEPGSGFEYSGGSYLILELLVEEVSGRTFEDFVQAEFFEPLEMDRSTFNFIDSIENNAGSYDRNGEKAALYKYASSAATAFATSATDLSTFVLAQLSNSGVNPILNTTSLENMRAPHGRTSGADIWGLGTILYSPTSEDDYVFGHDGGNDPAINSTARINPDSNDALVILETGHPSLATSIGSAWVLWQSGYPDILDTGSVIESMFLPAGIGTLGILMLAFFFLRRRKI